MRTNLTIAERQDIYNQIQNLVDIASSKNVNIYDDSLNSIRYYLKQEYQFRFVSFKEQGAYITDMFKEEQWTFALFVSEFILSGDILE